MIPADLARELAPYISPRALWGMDELCIALRRGRSTVQGYVARTDFPRAIRLAGRGYPLWWSDEVLDWVDRWQERA